MGVTLDERPGKGSHAVVSGRNGRPYTLPLHHGEKTELSDHYLRALCRRLEIDYEPFSKKL